MLAGSEERVGLDLAPIGCPKTTSGVAIQDSTRDIQLVGPSLLPIQPRLSTFAKADISVASVTSYIASSGQTTALSFITAQRHSQYQPSRRTDINHELLHPSRILDARANWCVYKSISQLPLDCYLRQPASDRGKCLRGHIIHQTTSERVEHASA
jgi:hypothetical protein